MAKAMIKVDVRRQAALFDALKAQQESRRSHGEVGFSVCIDNNKRHIGYVILEWTSLKSLHRFLESPEAKEMIASWPIVETLEVIELYELAVDRYVK